MTINTQINPNVTRLNVFNPIIIAEDDEASHVFVSQLYAGDEPLNISNSGNYTAKLNYKRADGVTGSVQGEITDGKITAKVPDEALKLDDYVVCNICVEYPKPVTTHLLSVSDGQLIVTPSTAFGIATLRTAAFKIDSQLSVITA